MFKLIVPNMVPSHELEPRTPLITNQSMREFHLVLCRILNNCGVTSQIKSHGATIALHTRLKI